MSHVEAYLLARRTSKRPRVSAVLACIRSQQETISKGASISIKFYLAPESAFDGPGELPEHLKAHPVSRDELAKYYNCENTDFNGFLIFHKTVDLKELPKWTSEVSFFA